VNEILCRALLRARLTDEDVAARLEVDPKTVRRWLDGRVPYLRHRWAIALLVGMDEGELWPQLRGARSRPGEVVTVYPHRDSVPVETWVRLFGSAGRDVGVLADSGFLLAEDSALLGVLAVRARSGVRVRVCLADPVTPEGSEQGLERSVVDALVAGIREALGTAEFRLYRVGSYNTICYADDDLMVVQQVYGVPAGEAPVLCLRRAVGGDMIPAYLGSFERIWARAQPPGGRI
jgi:hypothetical protein